MIDRDDLPIPQISPTAAEDLLKCRARALRIKPGSRRVETPALAIGNSSHAVAKRVYCGEFDDLPPEEASLAIAQAFETEIKERHARMSASAGSTGAPPPRRWQNYRAVHSRLPRFLASEVERRRDGTAPIALAVEERIESRDGVVFGYPDRVEQDGAIVRIVDLKSDLAHPEGVPEQYKRQLMVYGYLWNEVHGDWPDELAIQRVDGTLERFGVEITAINDLVNRIRRRRDSANEALAAGSGEFVLAEPASVTCDWCRRRPFCIPFLESLDHTYSLGGACAVGTVTTVTPGGQAQSIELKLSASNLGGVPDRVRIVGVDLSAGITSGDTVVVLDGHATSVPGQISLNAWSTLARVTPG